MQIHFSLSITKQLQKYAHVIETFNLLSFVLLKLFSEYNYTGSFLRAVITIDIIQNEWHVQ